MLHWNEARGVYDDVCYLRQAHLFQRFGLGGFDTDISRDDDGYLASETEGDRISRKRAAALPHADAGGEQARDPVSARHRDGAGAVSARASGGAAVRVGDDYRVRFRAARNFLRALGRSRSCSPPCSAVWPLYIMINPVKASYSMAPTMVVCALAGFLTARLFAGAEPRHRIWLTLLLGLLLGLSVNFRLPNLFLSVGYFLFFLISFLSTRKLAVAMRGIGFGVAFLDRHGADAHRQRDQCRQPVRHDLWRPGRGAAGPLLCDRRAVSRRHAIRPAGAGGRVDRGSSCSRATRAA